jgi:hypothetical protein
MYPNTDLPSYIKQESEVKNKSFKVKINEIENRIEAHTGSYGICCCKGTLIICVWFILSFITYYILSVFNLEIDAIFTLSFIAPVFYLLLILFIKFSIKVIIAIFTPLENEDENTDLPSYIKQKSFKEKIYKIENRIEARTGSDGIICCKGTLMICIWFIISFITYYILSVFNLEINTTITLSTLAPLIYGLLILFIVFSKRVIIAILTPLENEN